MTRCPVCNRMAEEDHIRAHAARAGAQISSDGAHVIIPGEAGERTRCTLCGRWKRQHEMSGAQCAIHRRSEARRKYRERPFAAEPWPLLYGPYHSPAVGIGDTVQCAVHGITTVAEWGEGTIPQPLGCGRCRRGVIVMGDLERALRVESASAIASHWGVSRKWVREHRRALGIPQCTRGTRRLLQHHGNIDIGAYGEEGAAGLAQNVGARQKRAESQARAMRGRMPHPRMRAASKAAAASPEFREIVIRNNRARKSAKALQPYNLRRRTPTRCKKCGMLLESRNAARRHQPACRGAEQDATRAGAPI